MSGLLAGKRLLITGVLTDQSLAYGVAKLLPKPPDVLELDVTRPDQMTEVAEDLQRRWGAVDGVLHAIGFAPPTCLGGGFLDAPWEDVSVALQISTFSLKALAVGMRPLMQSAGGG